MKVYLAGPMRNIEKFNFPAFDAAAVRLRSLGFDVINPADLDRDNGFNENDPAFTPDDEFMRAAIARDLVAIASCDAIALLPGWQKSAGTKVELTLARFLCLKILDAATGEPLADEPITAEAQRITTRDRRNVYGHPIDDFTRIGKMWAGLLGVEVTPEQVAACMILVKLGRLSHSPDHRDSLVDIAGYANCWDMIRQRKVGGMTQDELDLVSTEELIAALHRRTVAFIFVGDYERGTDAKSESDRHFYFGGGEIEAARLARWAMDRMLIGPEDFVPADETDDE